jgi:hypothetical protein
MNLDKTTYGDKPAALYLTLYLNEHGNMSLNRKVAKRLEFWRSLIKDVVMSHMLTEEMKTRTFTTLLRMIDAGVRESAANIPDKLAAGLVTNILIGEIKAWKRRAQSTAQLQKLVHRRTPQGVTHKMIKVMPRDEETDQERNERIKERSRQYLLRHGKKNTLY